MSKVNIHPTAYDFGVQLTKELEWLKAKHPDKLCLIHLAERFFTFIKENDAVIQGEPPPERGEAYECERNTGAAMQRGAGN